MDTTSLAYVLCRIEDDSSLTPVSRHGDFLTGIAAGGYAVEVEDLEFAYGGEGRIILDPAQHVRYT